VWIGRKIQDGKLLSLSLSKYIWPVFMVSLLWYPISGLARMYGEGRDEQRQAAAMSKANIRGSFTANRHPRYMGRLAYFSGCSYFYNIDLTLAPRQMDERAQIKALDSEITDAARLGVQYYLHFNSVQDMYRKAIPSDSTRVMFTDATLVKLLQSEDFSVWSISPEHR
jgi:hypothetical protein